VILDFMGATSPGVTGWTDKDGKPTGLIDARALRGLADTLGVKGKEFQAFKAAMEQAARNAREQQRAFDEADQPIAGPGTGPITDDFGIQSGQPPGPTPPPAGPTDSGLVDEDIPFAPPSPAPAPVADRAQILRAKDSEIVARYGNMTPEAFDASPEDVRNAIRARIQALPDSLRPADHPALAAALESQRQAREAERARTVVPVGDKPVQTVADGTLDALERLRAQAKAAAEVSALPVPPVPPVVPPVAEPPTAAPLPALNSIVTGLLDTEIRLWAGQLTDAEIAKIANQGSLRTASQKATEEHVRHLREALGMTQGTKTHAEVMGAAPTPTTPTEVSPDGEMQGQAETEAPVVPPSTPTEVSPDAQAIPVDETAVPEAGPAGEVGGQQIGGDLRVPGQEPEGAQPAGQDVEGEVAPLLESYTPEQLREREAAQARRDAEQRKADAEADAKARADAEVGSFSLSGSDSARDQAAARGQMDIEDVAAQNELARDDLAVVELPVAELTLSEDVPQFKSDADPKTGVVAPLGGKYQRQGTAPIIVWERLDGRKEVISGRHRLDLARRDKQVTIPAQVVKEADGFTAAQAAILDAELNIRDGQGKVKDYVNYFQQTGITQEEAQLRGLVARPIGQTAFAVANNGSADLIAAHRAGRLSDSAAFRIAEAAPKDERLQALGIQRREKGDSIDLAVAMMQAAKARIADRGQQETAGDLFGFDDTALREAEQMATVAVRLQRELSQEISATQGAAKAPERAAAGGVTVENPEQTLARNEQLKAERERWKSWATDPELVARIRAEMAGEPVAPAQPSGADLEIPGKPENTARVKMREKYGENWNQQYDLDKRGDQWFAVKKPDVAPKATAQVSGKTDAPTTPQVIKVQTTQELRKALWSDENGTLNTALLPDGTKVTIAEGPYGFTLNESVGDSPYGSKMGGTSINPWSIEHAIKRAVERHERKLTQNSQASPPLTLAQKEATARDKIAKKFLDGERFSGIAEARKIVYQELGLDPEKPASKKVAEELIEQAVVQAARSMVQNAKTPEAAFSRLVELYQQQPNLATRTSESVTDQAYSTPIPLAYLASHLAGIDLNPDAVVVEPTAGNGALLVAAKPDQVRANEKNRKRAGFLKILGFDTAQTDATVWQADQPADVLIANPPFGTVTVDGKKQSWPVPSRIAPDGRYTTTEIDHAIVLQQLSNLKDDGVAVLLVGGVDAKDETAKKNKYAGKAKRDFYWTLVNDYNVVDMFTVGGDLYSRQGAKYPVDVIVIHGRRTPETAAKTQPHSLPAAELPRVYESWDQLSEVIRNETNNPAWNPALKDAPAVVPGKDQPGTPGRDRPDTGERGGRPESDVTGSPQPVGGMDQDGKQGRDGVGDRGEVDVSGIPTADQAVGTPLESQRGPVAPDDRGAVAPESDAVERPSGYGQGNKVFTAEAAAAARERLRKKLGTLRSGIDPEMVQDGIILAGYHIEAGARGFAAYAKAMLDDLGDAAREHLRSWYEAARYYPGFDSREMTPTAETDRLWEEMQKSWAAPKPETKPTPAQADAATKTETTSEEKPSEGQTGYESASKIGAIGTLMPVNMRVAAQKALAELEARVGPVDDYVAKELGYDKKDLGQYFAAEQIDSLALAVDNLKRGKGYITADQTGVGKGRVNAGIMRWAIKNGKTPIFVTEKPNLYRDMIRDLRDIGMGQGPTDAAQIQSMIDRILITDADSSIPLDDAALAWFDEAEKAKENKQPKPKRYGEFLKTPAVAKQKLDFAKAISDARLSDGKEIIFTTYNQMNPKDGQRTFRHDFIDAFASNSILLLDESHNAGGSGVVDPNKFARSQYFRGLVERVDGAFYSSATFAKRPDVMDLYRRTDMALAVDNIDRLGETISAGGIPLQQVVSSMLVETGQLLRRERSFDGVQYETPTAPINQQVAENISTAMRKILAFSQSMSEVVKGIKTELQAQAASMGAQGGADLGSATSTGFASVMHNLIAQFLLGLKSQAAVNQALDALKAGEKPVITVANTLESLLEEYTTDAGINVGDPTDMSFGNLLERYLEKSRMVRERKPFQKNPDPARRLEDHELTPRALRAFDDALAEIRAHDWSDIPSSPIDFMKAELIKAGYTVGEITGRELVVDYLGSTPTLQVRGDNERGIPGRIRAIQQFNDGKIDVLIINRAGATGLSLHASPKAGTDLRRRHMIIAQAEANIDTHMQMLGRVHRTGQVVPPRYSQLVGDIPAEIRPAAVLAKKMASLNANTTSARSSAVTSKDALDFMNVYGDEAVAAVMFAHQDLHRQLGEPLKMNDAGDGFEAADAARKVTGYLPMLPLSKQEQVYRDIASEYRSILETAQAMGENKLEAMTLETDAREVSSTQVFDGVKGETSPFAGPARAVVYDIKRQGRAMTQDEIRQELAQFAGVPDATVGGALRKKADALRAELHDDVAKFLDAESLHLSEAQMASMENRARAMVDKIDDVLRTLPPGTSVSAVSAQGNVFYGTVIGIERVGKPKNPAVNSAWRIRIAVADSLRVLSLPLSRMEIGSADAAQSGRVAIEPYDPTMVQSAFDNQEGMSREERTILEGNLLAAYSQFPQGQIVYFRRQDGELRQGIVMPRSFDLKKAMAAKAAVMQTPAEAARFLADRSRSKYLSGQDGDVVLRYLPRADRFEMTTPKSKAKGGRWFLDDRLIALSDDGFVTVGNSYRADFAPSRLPALLDAVYNQLGERMKGVDLDQSQQQSAPDARYSHPKSAETKIRADDAAYLAAVRAGDMETAQRMVLEAARENGYLSESDYRMMHKAPNSKDDNNLATIKDSDLVPADYWTKPEWYQSSPEEKESFYAVSDALKRRERHIREGKSGDLVSIFVYRAVAKSVKEDSVRNGDWVTPSKEYAKQSGMEEPGGYRIITQRVFLKDLWWDGNSIAELGYDDGKGYVYSNTKNNRKLLEAVTYDDSSNVIPLSKRFNPRSSDVRFSSPSATTEVLTIPQARAQMVEALGESRVAALERAGMIEWLDRQPDGVPGVVQAIVSKDGKVIQFIPSNMDADAMNVALHESVHLLKDERYTESDRAVLRLAHVALRLVGLRNFIGNPGFNDLEKQVQRMAAEGHKEALQALAKVRELAEKGQVAPHHIAEESVAYLVEYGNPNLPIVRRILAAVRAALYRMGVKIQLRPEDVRALALSALKARADRARREERRIGRLSDLETAFMAKYGDAALAARRAEVLSRIKENTTLAEFHRLVGEMQENERYSAASPAMEALQLLRESRFVSDRAAMETLGEFPEYLVEVGKFIAEQRQKLVQGRMTPREVAKAYIITQGSIGADARTLAALEPYFAEVGMKTSEISPLFLNEEGGIRPEELTAWWLGTPKGQRALNALEEGRVDRDAFEEYFTLRTPFGKNALKNNSAVGLNKQTGYQWGAKPVEQNQFNLANLAALTGAINATQGNPKALEEVLLRTKGVGVAKAGFIGHLLGLGNRPTTDAVEINFWLTGKADTRDAGIAQKAKETVRKINDRLGDPRVGKEVFNRINQRMMPLAIRLADQYQLPRGVMPHLLHHWLWDKAKGISTTHAGMYEAMRRYSVPGRVEVGEATMAEFEAVRAQFQARQAQQTPFQKWFGKGTVGITAHPDGTPITLYHGTDNPVFNEWDASRAGVASGHPTSGLGFFMTADPHAATRYGDNVMALHAKIDNPYTLTDAELTGIETREDAERLRWNLMKQGYDGAVVAAPGARPYVIAFRSNQVKFVTNENPTKAPDFRYSTRGRPAVEPVVDAAETQDTPESSLAAVRSRYENTDQWLKAPNGQPTKLNERQWLQVRTPEFKRWFGDWENDPESASKVLDENGEPLVVYHGTDAEFWAFDPQKIGGKTDAGWLGRGFYFTSDTKATSRHSRVIDVFARVQNPLVLEMTGWDSKYMAIREYLGLPEENIPQVTAASAAEITNAAKRQGYDGVILDWSKVGYSGIEVVAFNPTQIKSAVGNVGAFSPTDPDIRYSHAGQPSPAAARQFFGDVGELSAQDTQPNILKRLWNDPGAWRRILSGSAGTTAADTRPTWLKLLSRQQMVEMLEQSPVADLAKLFEDTARLMDADKAELKNRAFPLAERVQTYASKARDKGRSLYRLWFYSTLEHVDPTGPAPAMAQFADPAAYREARQAYDRARQMYDELKAANPEAAKLFAEVRDEIKQSFDDYHNALRDRLARGANGIFNAVLEGAKESVRTAAYKKNPQPLTARLAALSQDDPAAYDALTDAVRERLKITPTPRPRTPAELADNARQQAEIKALRDGLPDAAQKALFDDVVANVQSKVKDSLDSLRSIYEQARQLEPYFPLSRWGQYQVYGEKAGQPKPVFASFEKEQDQKAAIAQLQKEGYTVKVNYQIRDSLRMNAPADSFLGRMFVTVDEMVSNPKEQEALKDELYQMYLKSLPELSNRKHFLHRKGIPGFSADALRGFAELANSRANAIARLRHSDTLTESLTDMERVLKRTGADPEQASAINRAGMIVEELQASYEWMMNPSNATWANRLTSFGFLWHLTNPSTALVNLTQVPIMAFPDLAAKFAPGSAFTAISRAIKEYGGWKFSRGDARIAAEKRLNDDYEGDMGKMLRSPLISSQISRTEAVMLAGMSDDAPEFKGGASGAAAALYRNALHYGGWLYNRAEIANREITVIAAYRLAREKAAADGMDRPQAHDYASTMAYNVMTRTQGDFSAANRAPFMRGNVQRVIFLFRSFSHLMTWRILRDAYQGVKGESPEVRREARARLGYLGLTSLAFGGAMGFPLYSAIALIANTVWGSDPDDPWDFETEMRGLLAEAGGETLMRTVMTGPVGQAPRLLNLLGLNVEGSDISPRVSVDLARLWMRRMPDDLEGGDAFDWYAAQVAGPLYGTLRGWTESARLLRQTQHQPDAWIRTMEGMTPAPIRNLFKGYRFHEYGVTNRRGDLIVDDVSYSGLLSQVVGFAPDTLADQYRINTRAWELKTQIEKRRRNIYGLFIFATEQNDDVMRDRALGYVERWNQLNPEHPITFDNLRSAYRSWIRARAQADAGVYIPSQGLRARVHRDLAGDDE